jgi:hypothetical protein
MDNKYLKARCQNILREYDDILKFILEEEIKRINLTPLTADSEFETLKKVYINEGIKQGLRSLIQKLNEYASK